MVLSDIAERGKGPLIAASKPDSLCSPIADLVPALGNHTCGQAHPAMYMFVNAMSNKFMKRK